MRPKIKLRPPIGTDLLNLQTVIGAVKSPKQMERVTALLQRYGVSKLPGLLPKQVAPFTTELKAVLSGQAPDPNDSILDPTMMEIR